MGKHSPRHKETVALHWLPHTILHNSLNTVIGLKESWPLGTSTHHHQRVLTLVPSIHCLEFFFSSIINDPSPVF